MENWKIGKNWFEKLERFSYEARFSDSETLPTLRESILVHGWFSSLKRTLPTSLLSLHCFRPTRLCRSDHDSNRTTFHACSDSSESEAKMGVKWRLCVPRMCVNPIMKCRLTSSGGLPTSRAYHLRCVCKLRWRNRHFFHLASTTPSCAPPPVHYITRSVAISGL